MTLDKQIILMEDLLSDDDHWSSKKAKSEYKQLLKWLKDYKRLLERPQGEWIYPEKTDKEKGYGGYCSNCKCDMPIFVVDWKQKYCETKFCPNCGAKMKGGKE